MKKLIRIALVGRPNVGKSALFNAICKKKISIVDEAEGITRDRLYAKTESFGTPFELIDTGGMGRKDDPYGDLIYRQAEIAIKEADSIIMVVDGTAHPLELDMQVARLLHRSKKPICLAINKIDNRSQQATLYEFSSLGIEKMIPVSAVHGYQIAELIEIALKDIEVPEIVEEENLLPHVAIVGRPNVGKSTLLNALVGDERSIVSPLAGTTRDSIDTEVVFKDKSYVFIDTAGIRKKQKEREVVEKFAYIRTEAAIERASVCLLMIDAIQGITTEEKKIAKMIEDAKKSCVILLNKWDLAKGFRMEHCLKGIEDEVPFLAHCPKICISALNKRNLDKIFQNVDEVLASYEMRVTTGQLNKCLTNAMQLYHPPVLGGKRLRVYYMTQVSTKPPHFVLFVNKPNLCEPTYQKYLVNKLRETFGFKGVPLVFQLKAKQPQKNAPEQRGGGMDRDLQFIPDSEDE
ncbi:MAG: ribosome biogenesis GTPase Der [Verrucomicrobia bacterium]|nr:ribosome biogenesis GTPase Der [Verrucomicrobiota bacterium]MBS0635876.1 ribosome biogenesis GTPase Der [Verrucomicrobiota bacterium]